MGISATATLFYGFVASEYLPDSDYQDDPNYARLNESRDWQNDFERAKGLTPPGHENYGSQEWRTYWDASRALMKAEPCTVEKFGSIQGGVYSYFVAAKDSMIEGCWEGPTVIDQDKTLEINPQWQEQLRAFCEVMGLEMRDPKWYLVCALS